MATAKRKDNWSRTSHLMVMAHNSNGGTPVIKDWDHFSPYAEPVIEKKASITELKGWVK